MKTRLIDAAKLQSRLHELLEYDPQSGNFTAKVSVGNVKAGTVRGNKDGAGYLRFMVDGTQYLSHILAWIYYYGERPELQLDHINGVKHDNRISNLREVSGQINSQNRAVRDYSGVTVKRNLFRAKIRICGKTTHLGYFCSAELAHDAYMRAKASVTPSAFPRNLATYSNAKAEGKQ